MKLKKEPVCTLEFTPDEANAARRLMLRLVQEFEFRFHDKAGGLEAIIAETRYLLRFSESADGVLRLRAENAPGAQVLAAMATGLTIEWRDPMRGPTDRRRAVDTEQANAVLALFNPG